MISFAHSCYNNCEKSNQNIDHFNDWHNVCGANQKQSLTLDV